MLQLPCVVFLVAPVLDAYSEPFFFYVNVLKLIGFTHCLCSKS